MMTTHKKTDGVPTGKQRTLGKCHRRKATLDKGNKNRKHLTMNFG